MRFKKHFVIASVLFLTSCASFQAHQELRNIESLRKRPLIPLDSIITLEQRLLKLDLSNETGWYYYLSDLLRSGKTDGFAEKIDSASNLIANPKRMGWSSKDWITTIREDYSSMIQNAEEKKTAYDNAMRFKQAIDSLPEPQRVGISIKIDGRTINLIRDNANNCWMNQDNYSEKYVREKGNWYRLK